MFGLFKSRKSKDIAKKRLQLVLSYERSGLPPNIVSEIKKDLVSVFSKYPYFDAKNIEVNLKREDSSREELWISIPLKD
ncbi:MAG: cell division topological specificity factor MinE [Aquificae bacterium]|nr:cell division topological specificity factor MinE [Aquificota bacterium]